MCRGVVPHVGNRLDGTFVYEQSLTSVRFHQASLLCVYKQDELGIAAPLDLNLISFQFGHYTPDPCLVRVFSHLLCSVTLLVLPIHHKRLSPSLQAL